jgi:3-phenylpropionate/trans-cinnamate dioxygenase ferredoxin subunit
MQNIKKYNWYKVAESVAEVTQRGERSSLEISVAGREICMLHYQEKLFACTAKCPHAGGRLSQGFMDGNGNIVCPVHRYRFNVKNGVNSSGEGYHLKTYPVKEEEDGIFIGIETPA